MTVFVKPGRKQESLAWDGKALIVGVKAPPVEGAANKRLVEVLAKWLRLGKSQVQLTKGHTSRHKTLEIEVDAGEFEAAVNALPRPPEQQQLL